MEGYFAYGEHTNTSPELASYSCLGVVCEVDSTNKVRRAASYDSVSMMHAVASCLRRVIEAVITRRS